MTQTKTLLACLLLAGTLAALPAAEAAAPVAIAGASGTPVNANCAPDGETMGLDGGRMFFPNAGCSASYDPADSGIPDGVALTAVHITYQVTGHVGTICGYFSFSGRITGSQPETCTAHDEAVDVEFSGTASGDPDADVVLTWNPTTFSWDNAYLASFVVERGTPPPPPVGPCTPLSLVGTVLSIVEHAVFQVLHKPIGHAIYCDLGVLGDLVRTQ